MRRIRTRTGAVSASDEADYLQFLETIGRTCERLASGDFEARVPMLPGPEVVQQVRNSVNRVADVTDAFIREASASLAAASDGRLYRRFLPGGMGGAYGASAHAINTARETMARTAGQVAREAQERGELADRIEAVSEQVAAASTELSASADGLSESTRHAVSRADGALQTVKLLEQSSTEIQTAVTLIKRIATQTRLLALNATIEAARASTAGLGFAVVASEVKTLAEEVNRSSDSIAAQVQTAQQAATDAVAAIIEIARVVQDMDGQVAGIAAAASGGAGGAGGGLSEMAEQLHAETRRFVTR